MDHIQALIDKLEAESRLSREEWITLIEGRSPNLAEYLFEKARKWQHRIHQLLQKRLLLLWDTKEQ